MVREAYGWRPDDLVISYVSRIAPEKNVAYLAERPGRSWPPGGPMSASCSWATAPSRGELERRIGAIARFAGYRTARTWPTTTPRATSSPSPA